MVMLYYNSVEELHCLTLRHAPDIEHPFTLWADLEIESKFKPSRSSPLRYRQLAPPLVPLR